MTRLDKDPAKLAAFNAALRALYGLSFFFTPGGRLDRAKMAGQAAALARLLSCPGL